MKNVEIVQSPNKIVITGWLSLCKRNRKVDIGMEYIRDKNSMKISLFPDDKKAQYDADELKLAGWKHTGIAQATITIEWKGELK